MSVVGPDLVKVKEFRVVGLKVKTKNEDEFNPQTAKIPQLWEDFLKSDVPHRKSKPSVYGVYAEYESDCNGFYTVTAGVEVDSYEDLDKQFSIVDVKKGEYLLFKNSGPIPQAIIETWEVIWAYFKEHPEVIRAYETDFEMCEGLDGCAVYIGV